jgi:1-deoxy-D-xylulose-5-phosphate reductoisomerase
MRLPIQIALMHPEKYDIELPRFKPSEIGNLSFEEPDTERFPALNLARDAYSAGGTAPAILNAANEAAVAAFLNRRIGFTDICRLVAAARETIASQPATDLETIQAADLAARKYIESSTGAIPASF